MAKKITVDVSQHEDKYSLYHDALIFRLIKKGRILIFGLLPSIIECVFMPF